MPEPVPSDHAALPPNPVVQACDYAAARDLGLPEEDVVKIGRPEFVAPEDEREGIEPHDYEYHDNEPYPVGSGVEDRPEDLLRPRQDGHVDEPVEHDEVGAHDEDAEVAHDEYDEHDDVYDEDDDDDLSDEELEALTRPDDDEDEDHS